jgi:hypothetical protein
VARRLWSLWPSYAHLADSLARLHCVPPNELGSAELRLVADSFARFPSAPLVRLRSRCSLRSR